jgi:hypothetical protein
MRLFCKSLIICFVCGLNLVCSTQVRPPSSIENGASSRQKPGPHTENDIAARRLQIEERMLKGVDLHDGSLDLHSIGDINSVPALLVVLRENRPSADGVMACTTEHALEALRKITGADPGITHEAWKAWWEKQKAQSSDRSG